jgi:hypothetical protein
LWLKRVGQSRAKASSSLRTNAGSDARARFEQFERKLAVFEKDLADIIKAEPK